MEREKIRVIKSSYTCEDVTFLSIDEIIKICEDAKSEGATSVCISASTNWDDDIDEIELEFYREELESEESFEKRIEAERLREESVRKYIEKYEKEQLAQLLKKYPNLKQSNNNK